MTGTGDELAAYELLKDTIWVASLFLVEGAHVEVREGNALEVEYGWAWRWIAAC